MKTVIRQVIRMKNGDYMRQDLDDTKVGTVLIRTVDHPIDASLFKDKKLAETVIFEMLGEATTSLPIVWDRENPPEEVETLVINVEVGV